MPLFRALILLVALFPVPLWADEADAAMRWVEQTAAALSAATGGEEAVAEVLSARFDLAAMALACLPEERRVAALANSSYTTAYAAFLAREFTARAAGGEGDSFRLLGSRAPKPGLLLVGSEVQTPAGTRRVVEWYLPDTPPFRVLNIAVEGVLITADQRRDFAALLAAGGLDALTRALETGEGLE